MSESAPAEAEMLPLLNPVGFHIPDELAHLALRGVDLFERLPLKEAMKIEHILVRKEQKLKLTAISSRDLFALVGFVFAMELKKLRDAKIKELTDVRNDSAE